MVERRGFVTQQCPECDGEEFFEFVNLCRHATQGTTTRVKGWKCLGCGSKADMDRMWELQQAVQLEAELADVQRRLAAQKQSPPSAAKKTALSALTGDAP